MTVRFRYRVVFPADNGVDPFEETVVVRVKRHPYSKHDKFADFMQDCIADWFYNADVSVAEIETDPLRNFALGQALCPLCHGLVRCDESCDYYRDNPQRFFRMECARRAIADHDGE